MSYSFTKFEGLIGKTIQTITRETDPYGEDSITFVTADGEKFMMFHSQDCCESVNIEEIIGDFSDLIDNPILTAEERMEDNPNARESGTYTFYELATIKGSVTIRWYGESNGYYSESATFRKVT